MTSTSTGSRVRRVAAAAAAALFAITALSACSSSAATTPTSTGGAAAEAPALRLGYFANITHALPLIGVQDEASCLSRAGFGHDEIASWQREAGGVVSVASPGVAYPKSRLSG